MHACVSACMPRPSPAAAGMLCAGGAHRLGGGEAPMITVLRTGLVSCVDVEDPSNVFSG